MTATYTPDRAETVIEEIATAIRDFVGDAKGLAVVHLQLIRPGEGGKRMYITYRAEEGDKKNA